MLRLLQHAPFAGVEMHAQVATQGQYRYWRDAVEAGFLWGFVSDHQ